LLHETSKFSLHLSKLLTFEDGLAKPGRLIDFAARQIKGFPKPCGCRDLRESVPLAASDLQYRMAKLFSTFFSLPNLLP
jgi:hypothetical protein